MGGPPELMDFEVKAAKTEMTENNGVRTTLELYKQEVTLKDMDAFTNVICQTKNRELETMASILIISVMTRNSNVSEGADVSMECKPDTDVEGLSITWYRSGQPISDNERYNLEANSTRLIVKDSRPEDAGVYTCNMTFPSTVKPGQTLLQDVILSGKPYLVQDVPTSVETLMNQTLSITCPVGGYPQPRVYWIRGGDTELKSDGRTKFMNYGKISGATVMITNLTDSDLGEYTCEAENDMGRLIKEFRVGLVGAAVPVHGPGLATLMAGTLTALFLGMRSVSC